MAKTDLHIEEGEILFTGRQYIYVKTGELTLRRNGKLTGTYVTETVNDWEAAMHKQCGAVIITKDPDIPIPVFPE